MRLILLNASSLEEPIPHARRDNLSVLCELSVCGSTRYRGLIRFNEAHRLHALDVLWDLRIIPLLQVLLGHLNTFKETKAYQYISDMFSWEHRDDLIPDYNVLKFND